TRRVPGGIVSTSWRGLGCDTWCAPGPLLLSLHSAISRPRTRSRDPGAHTRPCRSAARHGRRPASGVAELAGGDQALPDLPALLDEDLGGVVALVAPHGGATDQRLADRPGRAHHVVDVDGGDPRL